jgi:hypothetical protein
MADSDQRRNREGETEEGFVGGISGKMKHTTMTLSTRRND